MKQTFYSSMGILSIILSVLGLIFYFIGWFFFSFMDNRLYGMMIGLVLSILSIVLGHISKKQGDTYGMYGMIIGSITVIIAIITVTLVTPTSIEYGYYT